MSPGYESLGRVLVGGGAEGRDRAYRAGIADGIRERRQLAEATWYDARTQAALLEAAERRERNAARQSLGAALTAGGLDPALAPLLVTGAASLADLTTAQAEQNDRRERTAARQGLGAALTAGGLDPELAPLLSLGVDYSALTEGADRAATRAIQSTLADATAPAPAREAAMETLHGYAPRQAAAPAAEAESDKPLLSEIILPGGKGRSVLHENIDWRSAFGAGSTVLQGVNAVLDYFGMGTPAPATRDAIQAIRELANATSIALRDDVGDRIPLAVQDILNEYAENPLPILRGEQMALQGLLTTRNYVQRATDDISRLLNYGGPHSATNRAKFMRSYRRLANMLADYDFLLDRAEEAGYPKVRLPSVNDPPPADEEPEDGWVQGDGFRYRVLP